VKIPFVGPTYQARSLGANAQRTVNCYLEMDQGSPRAPVALYGMPGLVLRATLNAGPTRGCIQSGGYWYFVSDNSIYRLSTSYQVEYCGGIGTYGTRVGLATNGTEVLLVDGQAGYLITGTSVSIIVDPDFPNGVTSATFQDGYFLVTGDNSPRFYWNETPNTGSVWNGLDFASAEGSPDNTKANISDHRELWLFGAESAEVWINTGDATSLFQRSGNTFIEQGTASAHTVAAMDNTVYWLGANKTGQGIVFKAQGYSPVRISNHALETAMAGYSTISDAYSYCFQMEGHSFYVLTFPTADATWVYDAATGEWVEWLWRDPATNELHRHRSVCCAFNNGVHLVGDWENGNVYSLDLGAYTDGGDPILRLRRTQTMSEENRRLFFTEVVIDMETGVGGYEGDGEAFEPEVQLRFSNDGGHTWSNERRCKLGGPGEYGKRIRFGPTGSGRHRVWELSMTDPVKFAVFGASARVEKGAA
jgi:hypothetical protein